MQTRSLAILLSVVAFAAASCGGSTRNTSLTPSPNRDTIESAPKWFLNPPSDEDSLFAAATATSRDLQVAINKAQTQARTDLAQQMAVRMANLTKQFQEETGLGEESEFLTQFSSATKAVTEETLVGVRTSKRKVTPDSGLYRAYVLMSLPIGKANMLLSERLRANEALHTRLRSTQAFRDLESELDDAN